MARQTEETLLIAGLLNLQDASAYAEYGLTSEHLFGYRAEFDWIQAYNKRYSSCPTKGEFLAAFPDFKISEEQEDIRWLCTTIMEQYAARQLTRAMLKASKEVKAGQVDEAYANFRDLAQPVAVARPKNLLDNPAFLETYDDHEDRIKLPWKTVQQHTDGMGNGEFWVYAARQGMGKSQMLLEAAVHAAMAGRSSIIFALEMTQEQMEVRAHTVIAHKLGMKISHHDLRTKRYDKLAYKKLLDEIRAGVPGKIDILTPREMRATPAAIEATCGDYDLTVIDHIGLLHTNAGLAAVSDWRVAAELSNEMKRIALAKNARILVASQINREGDSANGRPPRLKHLTGTDALGQDADVAITMARFSRSVSAQSLEKNRHGDSEVPFYTRFDADYGDYSEINRDKAYELRDHDEDFRD